MCEIQNLDWMEYGIGEERDAGLSDAAWSASTIPLVASECPFWSCLAVYFTFPSGVIIRCTFRKSYSIMPLNLELNFTLWSYTIDLSLSYIGGLFYDVKFQPYILLDTYLVANSANAEPMPFLSTYPDAKFLILCIYFRMVSCSWYDVLFKSMMSSM